MTQNLKELKAAAENEIRRCYELEGDFYDSVEWIEKTFEKINKLHKEQGVKETALFSLDARLKGMYIGFIDQVPLKLDDKRLVETIAELKN